MDDDEEVFDNTGEAYKKDVESLYQNDDEEENDS